MFELKNVSKIYNLDKSEKQYALSNISLKLPDRGLVGIVGPSGSGKSTLMYCLSTLKEPTEGQILYNEKSLINISEKDREKLRREEFGFVFQKHYLVPYMDAIDNVTVAATSDEKTAKNVATELLGKMGLSEREYKKRPKNLSGGQCQRVAIARAMINSPKVLFADEPTASLDHENAFAVMKVMKEYSKNNLVIVITHDHSILKDEDMMVEMWDGNISSIKEAKDI